MWTLTKPSLHSRYYMYLGWCGSVDWVLACEPKGHQFHSQSRHRPGLQARSPVGGAWEATTHWCFSPFLSPSLPLCWKINKYNLKKRYYMHIFYSKSFLVPLSYMWFENWIYFHLYSHGSPVVLIPFVPKSIQWLTLTDDKTL